MVVAHIQHSRRDLGDQEVESKGRNESTDLAGLEGSTTFLTAKVEPQDMV